MVETRRPERRNLRHKTVVESLPVPPSGEKVYWDTSLHGYGCRVRASGRKTFLIRYRTPGGRQRWFKIGTFGAMTPAAAWDAARMRLATAPQEDPARTREQRRTQPTVADAVDRYLREKLPELAATDQPTRRAQLGWWRRELGSIPLADLARADVVAARDRLAATPVNGQKGTSKPRSPATVNRYVAAFSRLLSVATGEWEWLDASPARRLGRAREARGRERFLSGKQARALVAAAEADRQRLLGPLVVLALSTGARRGELLGLRWGDVDLKRGFVTFKKTKNRETRSVPVTGRALEDLRRLSRVRRLNDDRVLPLTIGALRGGWRRATRAAGLEGFVFHGLRHSAASWLVMCGVPLREVAEILGHKTLTMVQRYSHFAPEHLRDSVEKMTSLLGI